MNGHVLPWVLFLTFAPCVRAGAAPTSAEPEAGGKGRLHAVPLGPAGTGAVVAAAIDPADPARIALATGEGAVWITDDGGRRWRMALGPEPRGEGHGVGEEVADGVGWSALPEVPDPADLDPDPEALDAAWEAYEDEVEAVRRAVEAHAAHEEAPASGDGSVGAALVFHARALAVARTDGLWIRAEDGRSWSHRPEPPGATVLAVGPGGLYVGASDGLWITEEPGRAGVRRVWRGPEVRGIAVEGARVWIAGLEGLLVLEGNEALRILDRPLEGVTSAGGAVWAHGGGELYRVRGGAVAASVAPPGGLVALAYDPDVGFVAAGPRGLWSAADPDRGWSRVEGPRAPAGVVGAGGEIVVVGPAGAHRLEAGEDAPSADLPLALLIDAVVLAHRPAGLVPRSAGSVPDLTVYAVATTADRERTVSERGAARGVAETWRVGVRLDWSPRPGRRPPEGKTDPAGFDPMGGGLLPPRRGGADDRLERIVALYERRAAWLDVERRSPAASLLERTLAQIGAEECEALLDLLTDGAVTRWRAGAP